MNKVQAIGRIYLYSLLFCSWCLAQPTEMNSNMLESDSGIEWLASTPGQEWLESSAGREWLWSPFSLPDIMSWFWSWIVEAPRRGARWLDSAEGQAWVIESDGGHAWYYSENGMSWAKTDSRWGKWLDGRLMNPTWFETKPGKDYLASRNKKFWFDTITGKEWLRREFFPMSSEGSAPLTIQYKIPFEKAKNFVRIFGNTLEMMCDIDVNESYTHNTIELATSREEALLLVDVSYPQNDLNGFLVVNAHPKSSELRLVCSRGGGAGKRLIKKIEDSAVLQTELIYLKAGSHLKSYYTKLGYQCVTKENSSATNTFCEKAMK